MSIAKITQRHLVPSWNYYRDEPNNPPIILARVPPLNYNANPITNSASFKYKSRIIGNTGNNDNDNNNVMDGFEIAVPLMHLSNFGEH